MHWLYLAKLLERNGGEFMAGSSLSIADIAAWDLLDTHLRIFSDEFKTHVGGWLAGRQRCDVPACWPCVHVCMSVHVCASV